MTTNTLDNRQVPTQLNQLIFGDRNTYIFFPDESNTQPVDTGMVSKFLYKLEKKGYAISNANVMLNWTVETFNNFKDQFLAFINANTKKGLIFRVGFGKDKQLEEYSHLDWVAILAQYSITYSWSDEYAKLFGQSAEQVLDEYVHTMSDKTFKQTGKTRVFKLGSETDLTAILRDIVESPVVLRTQQLKTLEAAPAGFLAQVCSNAKITIKETLVKVMTLISGQKLDKPILKTATDVVRYVLATSVDEPFEGQITKNVLKTTKHRIPTRIRKALLNNMEAIAKTHNDGVKFLTEDMLTFENYWQRLDKHLRFTKSRVMRERFPNYTQAIDLLYIGDRSWTFNGRISAAKAEFDYDAAIRIAAERPGFLLRNIIEFIRMSEGKLVPVKAQTRSGNKLINAFQKALLGDKAKTATNRIKKDASAFFNSDDFINVISHKLNTKLAWQLIEQLNDKSLTEPVYEREVQGQYIKYTTPIPGAKPELIKQVHGQILKAIKVQLRERNQKLGKIFIDENAKAYKLQYSGRLSTELSFSGEFLSPGSEVNLSDYLGDGKSRIHDPIIRLGVMWRSRPEKNISIDIDHNVKLDNGIDVYYGSPVYKVGSKVLVTSSGDITSCGSHKSRFSVELIDLDPVGLSQIGIKNLYSSMINYSGGLPIGALECYLFFTLINRKDRIMGDRTRIACDLSGMDYAIQVDANNSDKTGSYIGLQIDLENDKIKALCIPVKHKGRYTNIKVNRSLFNKALAKMPDHLTIDYALQKALTNNQLTNDPSEADVIISRNSLETIFGGFKPIDELINGKVLWHPGRNAEQINKLLF